MAAYEHNSDKFGYINLEDLEGVQTALDKLGFNPGDIDGKDGPNTQNAVRMFQAHASIDIDGIVGPVTRQALKDDLDRNSVDVPTEAFASYEGTPPPSHP